VPLVHLLIICTIFFLTSSVSVVTGSTSLITVPVLITFGIEPHVAVASNMLALIFMSVGGSLPFAYRGVIERRILPLGIILSVIGSALGALLLLRIHTKTLQLTIVIAMIAISVLSLLRHDQKADQRPVTFASEATGYLLTFALAIYGGLFSGGYVTMLTAVFVFLLGLSFLQAVATTKVINVFSSLIATAIFAVRGVIDYKLGLLLGAAMFLGAVLGGHIAIRLSAVWLRRVFIVAVFALAAKMLIGLVSA
jgi:uncharacterized protein